MSIKNIITIYHWWLNQRHLKKIDAEFDHKSATPELTAERFKLLFNRHGVETSEIPEISGFESISLYDLNSNDRLLQKLTPEFLNKTANLFGVRLEWLRSGEPNMYQHRHWYKSRLSHFFEDLKEIDFEGIYDPFFVITTVDKFDVHATEHQPFILVLRKNITEIGDKDVFKYFMEAVWDWHHPPCRLQAKGLATKYYELTKRMVTIYKTSSDNFHHISEGFIPPEFGLRRNQNISFEQYGTIKLPYGESYEVFEHSAILDEMKFYEIDNIDHTYINVENQVNSEAEFQEKKSKSGRKVDQRKLKVKERFVKEYHYQIESDQISCAKAAREFYDKLNNEEEKLLSRSEKDFQNSTSDELRDKAVRTLTEYYREYKKMQRSTDN